MTRLEQKIRRVLLGLAIQRRQDSIIEECQTGPCGSGSIEFQEAPSLLSPAPGRGRALKLEGRAGLGFPPGGGAASRRPPLHLELRRQMLQLFLILSGGVNPRPALPVPPSPSPLGSCPPSCGEANCSGDSGRGERPGLGLEGRGEEKGKAEAREIRRREKSRARRRGESEDGGEHILEVTTPRLRLAWLSWGRGKEGGTGRARGRQETAGRGSDLPRVPGCGRAGPALPSGLQSQKIRRAAPGGAKRFASSGPAAGGRAGRAPWARSARR